jgi:hypothetical protein
MSFLRELHDSFYRLEPMAAPLRMDLTLLK